MGGPPCWGLGVRFRIPHSEKIKDFYETLQRASELVDSLDKRPELKKMDMRFRTWKVAP
jgi:hypothetical protein